MNQIYFVIQNMEDKVSQWLCILFLTFH